MLPAPTTTKVTSGAAAAVNSFGGDKRVLVREGITISVDSTTAAEYIEFYFGASGGHRTLYAHADGNAYYYLDIEDPNGMILDTDNALYIVAGSGTPSIEVTGYVTPLE